MIFVCVVFVCTRIWEKIKQKRARKRKRVGGIVGGSEGLQDPHEMPFDTGNLFVVVVTKSRKTGPLRPRCSKRLA